MGKCKDCKWCDGNGNKDDDIGDCHRYPPRILMFEKSPLENEGLSNLDCWYPVTTGDDWCGEFKAK